MQTRIRESPLMDDSLGCIQRVATGRGPSTPVADGFVLWPSGDGQGAGHLARGESATSQDLRPQAALEQAQTQGRCPVANQERPRHRDPPGERRAR